jgi:hypothetical protein
MRVLYCFLLPPPGTHENVDDREAKADDEGYEQYDWSFTHSEQ